jgi:hypothetical protein
MSSWRDKELKVAVGAKGFADLDMKQRLASVLREKRFKAVRRLGRAPIRTEKEASCGEKLV